jgi:hypothetical protein
MSTSNRPISRRQIRLHLGGAAVLSVAEAAEQLPMPDDEAVAWLEGQGIVVRLVGRRVVIWGDVLNRVRESSAASDDDELTEAETVKLRRAAQRCRGGT